MRRKKTTTDSDTISPTLIPRYSIDQLVLNTPIEVHSWNIAQIAKDKPKVEDKKRVFIIFGILEIGWWSMFDVDKFQTENYSNKYLNAIDLIHIWFEWVLETFYSNGFQCLKSAFIVYCVHFMLHVELLFERFSNDIYLLSLSLPLSHSPHVYCIWILAFVIVLYFIKWLKVSASCPHHYTYWKYLK